MREQLEKLLAAGRDNALLRFGLGNACLKEGDPAAAALHLGQATQQNPAHSAAWKLLGKALQQLERPQEAEAAWEKGLEVAVKQGDIQSSREMTVFLKRLRR
ncbi:tetratricopeptide repeat protein [Massilia antarctica]|uniref:tetratricopeptide repeat protein n=1 Tax=Massilia antarctica TaxID=2765360 RepID=UPI0006BB6E97|nr:tetratricopeptide repeat protein [Massilia sp. H27-R4]MCY0911813.1 tetratricopeptide repeat protein [Massilia sp. H27-R4]CUI06732.1 FOG: TPR repeat [Janthinobacterium sp. CG23_2]CUU30518.1 FOG: TPR repeat [Janthinobacterium sp. CG23_2]